jgi:hypothetical protein
MRALGVLALGLACCGDDDGACANLLDAGTSGVTVTVGAQTFTYGDFESSIAGDCGPREDSVTISGFQVTPVPTAPHRIAFCLPDRNRVGSGPIPLEDVVSFFVAAESPSDGCVYSQDTAQGLPGTVTLPGFCKSGVGGFSVSFAGTLPGTSSCSPDPVSLELGGAALIPGFAIDAGP